MSFNQKGFSKNFLSLMKDVELIKQFCCDPANTIFGGGGAPPTPYTLIANNGLSVDTVSLNAVLGQDVGDVFDPALLLNNREIPYNGLTTLSFRDAGTTLVDTKIGALQASRHGVKINGRSTNLPTLWLFNTSSTTYKDWLIEVATTDTGRLEITDNTGLFFIMNRNLASISAPLHCSQKVLDVTVSTALSLANNRPRHVFTNRGAVGDITITLPTVSASNPNWPEYTFTSVNEFSIIIEAPVGRTIRIGSMVSASGGTVRSTGHGDTVRLQFLGTASEEWQAIAVVGNWITP